MKRHFIRMRPYHRTRSNPLRATVLWTLAIGLLLNAGPLLAQGPGATNAQEVYSSTGQVTVYGLADRGGQVFNLKAYGAKGNGTTNDSSALHSADNAASSVRGWLLFPPSSGAYVLTGASAPTSPISWTGSTFTGAPWYSNSLFGRAQVGKGSLFSGSVGEFKALSSYTVNTQNSDLSVWNHSTIVPYFTSSIMATMKVPASSPFQNNDAITAEVANEGSNVNGGGAVAGLFHATALADHAPIWGVNPGITVGIGLDPALAHAFAGEFDVNNRTGTDMTYGGGGQIVGVEIESGGTNRPSLGLSIVSAKASAGFAIGANIQNYGTYGAHFVNGAVGSTAIGIQVPANDTANAIQVVSTTGQKVFQADDSGNVLGVSYKLKAGPTWTAGSGAPSGPCRTGSLYSNTSGRAGTTLYVCEAGAWAAK